jgi:hypothetical protein
LVCFVFEPPDQEKEVDVADFGAMFDGHYVGLGLMKKIE